MHLFVRQEIHAVARKLGQDILHERLAPGSLKDLPRDGFRSVKGCGRHEGFLSSGPKLSPVGPPSA
jgi:hypothetical protein